MKIKFTVIDDDGKEHSGEIDLSSGKSAKKIGKTVKSEKTDNYKGVGGGIRLLLDNNFFSSLKSVEEVKEELEKEGYFHSKETISTALGRDFVKTKKILTRVKRDGSWRYAIRK